MNPIKERRLERGLTQKQLAEAVGVVPSTIKGWESGQYKPPLTMLSKIAAVLLCDANDAIWTVEVAPDKPTKQLSAEELARRETNKEKARPYIERRLALGLKKKDLAEKAGITADAVRAMESGRSWPCWDTRQKLRRVLGMPEERCYTEEERNVLFFELEESIHWLIRRNMARICRVHMDVDDLYQDLAVCALRAIDRFQPDGEATLKTFVERNMSFHPERKLVQFCMHGLSGKVHYPLPNITVFSLDALMEEGLQLEGDSGDFEYNEENRPRWCEHQRRQAERPELIHPTLYGGMRGMSSHERMVRAG